MQASADPILFLGDVHLGRRPTSLSGPLQDLGLSPQKLSPAATLSLTVDHALRVGARALVFAGDVVEALQDRFEAYAVLEREVKRLADAGVPVYGVAGNHDGVALPRLAARLDGFHLLGEGGTWEQVAIPGDGPPVALAGWSFPQEHHRANPLDAPGARDALRRPAQGALLGVLHGDLDASGSPYAPVRSADLARTEADAWFLGHIHRPHPLHERPFGYLGSLCGLDIGEPGARGPWEVRVHGREVVATQVPLAPIRWEHLHLDVSECADADAVHTQLVQTLRGLPDHDPTLLDRRLQVVVVRVFLVGRRQHGQVAAELIATTQTPMELTSALAGKPVILESLHDLTRPAVDLPRLATQPTPAGRLAALIQRIEAEGADAEVLAQLRAEADRWPNPEPLPGETLRAIASQAAWKALDTLLQTRTEAR